MEPTLNTLIRCTRADGPLGPMLLAARGDALTGLWLAGQKDFPAGADAWTVASGDTLLRRALAQLDEYFEGRRAAFDLPVRFEGTAFQREVWSRIAAVPLGASISYGALAAAAGRPAAARAAGAATGRNPVSLIVPCHRVMGAGGAITGYAGGLHRKHALLAFEAAVARGERARLADFVTDVVPSRGFRPMHATRAA